MTQRLWLILSCAVAIVAVVLLSAGLSGLELQPGHPLPRFRQEEEAVASLPQLLRSELVRYIAVVIYLLALVLIPVSIVYLVVNPEARRRAIRILILSLLFVALILLARTAPESQEPPQVEPEVNPILSDAPAPTVEFVANPPQWAVVVSVAGLALLAAFAVVGILWLAWSRSRPSEGPLEQLAGPAEQAIAAIRVGADLRDTVMRCYFEMGRVLREQRGISRDEAMTPREFERYLAQEGLPRKPVGQLTRLFEMVRYGAKDVGKREELEAMDCLTAIVEACRGPV